MTSPLRPESLNEQDQRRIDIAKEAFQSSLEGGRQPRIEDFLSFVPERLATELLPELLLAEFSIRRVAGDSVSSEEYVARFPTHTELILKLLEDSVPSGHVASSGSKVETGRDGQTLLVGRGLGNSQTAELPPRVDSKTVPEEFGRYRIERELGRGGMGAVYLAHDVQLDRKVALKIPFFRNDDDDAEAVERFYREARAMATVQHANLCPVFDVGRFEHWHFLTMAYIDGQPLSKLLKESGGIGHCAGADVIAEGRYGRPEGAPGGHRASRPEAVQHHADERS